MGVQHESITVGTTATALSGVADRAKAEGDVKRTVVVQNPSASVTVYIGGSGVTSSSYGYALGPGKECAFDLTATDVLYAAVAASTQAVNVLHLGV